MPLIIILNLWVFWRWWQAGDDDPYMANNFLVSWDALAAGRWWTLITSVFSHNWLLHLLINMFVLNSFGSLLESVLGSKRFLFFYLLAGVVSSFCHSYVSAFYIGLPDMSALGASGSVAGLVLLFALLFPREKLLLLGIIPLPAIFGALAFVGLDLWGLMAQAGGGGLPIGHGAHLGGAFTGIVFYFLYLRPRLKGRRVELH